jgi:DNA-binding NarL/FixJ family response regulator
MTGMARKSAAGTPKRRSTNGQEKASGLSTELTARAPKRHTGWEHPDPSWKTHSAHLRAESRRLRFELLNAQLDLRLVILNVINNIYAVINPESAKRLQLIACQSYSVLTERVHTAGFSASETAHLRVKVEHLNRALSRLGHTGGTDPLCSSASDVAVLRNLTQSADSSGGDGLTRRETQVLKFIAEGYSTKQVAAKLGISFKTAVCHRYRLMEKLKIHDTATLVRYALRKGVVQL